MKKILIATTLLLSSGLVFATEKSHEHDTSSNQTTMTQDKSAVTDKNMSMMHEKMQKMQAQMTEINKTEDPDKRDALLKAHMNSMQDMMKNMNGEKMMGQGMKMSDGKMMEMPQDGMMDKRMNMMQMMMDQMMQNQAASEKTRNIREKGHEHVKQ